MPEERLFRVVADWEPAGDQPKAIEELSEALLNGAQRLTLLGATGTGKSLDADEPILLYRQRDDGSWVSSCLPIGAVVDANLAQAAAIERDGDTEISRDNPHGYHVVSFNPRTHRAELKPITAFVRHEAPKLMYRVRLECGRESLITGDHNLWVRRGGKLILIETSEARQGDEIPLPEELPSPETGLEWLQLDELVCDQRLGVHRDEHQNLKRDQKQGVKQEQSLPSAQHEDSLQVRAGSAQLHDAPARLPVTRELLERIGFFIATGFVAEESSRRKQLPAHLLGALCGNGASERRLPSFWGALSRQQLAWLLRAYFDAATTVREAAIPKDAISCETPGRQLASDLAYALARFGIWARIEPVRKEGIDPGAAVAGEQGRQSYRVILQGYEALSRFSEEIGFRSARKQRQLEALLRKASHRPDASDQLAHRSSVRHGRNAVHRVMQTATPLKIAAGGERAVAALTCGTMTFAEARLQPIALGRDPVETAFEARGERGQPERDYPEGDDPEWGYPKWSLQISFKSPSHHQAALQPGENSGRVRWSKIISVEPVPYERRYVYDVSVAENETFLGGFGGLFLHNTYTMAKVIERVQKPTLVIAHNKTLAAQLCSEFRSFFPDNAVHYFISYYDYYQPEAYIPQTDTYIEKDASINDEIDRLRHAATSALFERRDVIIVASVSCIYGLGSPEDYVGMTLSLKHGDFRDRDNILRRLVGIRYERNDIGFTRGTFRVRGDVIEIIPAYEENVIRIEFFGDEVDRILELDPITGEIIAERDSITIYPATHYITSEDKMKRAIASIEAELQERLAELRAQGKLLEAQRLQQRTEYDLEMLREVGVCQGIENYSRHLTGRAPGEPPATLLDYFPGDFLMFIDESHQTIPQIGAMYRGDRSRKETLVEHGFRLPSALDNRPLTFEEFEARMNQVVFVSATPGPYEKRVSEKVVEQIIRPTGLVDPEVIVRPIEGQIDDLLEEIRVVTARGERVLVTTLTKKMAEDLTDYLADVGVRVRYLHSEIESLERMEILRDLRLGEFDVLVGINLLREGLDLPEVSLVAILDADKEGFLRSETSLIQTIGRAARNVNGRVIMYADVITGSMQRAIDETNRRRKIQMEYNEKHGITPETVRKRVHEVIRAERVEEEARSPKEQVLDKVKGLTAEELAKYIQELEKEMFDCAKRLEFERAAELRDEIEALRSTLLEFTG